MARASGWLFLAMSSGSFALAVYFLFQGNNIAAGIASTLFLVSALLTRLPEIEFFKALGVETRLSRQLDRAEELFDKLRTTSLVSARNMYHQLAWGDRMGSPTLGEKRRMVEEIDAMLAGMNADPKQIEPMKGDLLRFVAFDLISVFESIYVARRAIWQRDWSREFKIKIEAASVPEERKRLQEEFDEGGRYLTRKLEEAPKSLDTFRPSDEIDEYLARRLPDRVAADDDLKTMRALATELGDMYRDCRRDGNISTSAIVFLGRYASGNSWLDKYHEIFKDEPDSSG